MSDTEKNSWLSSPTTMIAIATVLLNCMGFLTVSTFNVRMGLPVNLFEDTPISYLQWGAKALVFLVVFIIGITIALSIVGVILSFVLRQTIFRIKTMMNLRGRFTEYLRKAILRMDSNKIIIILFIAALILFGLYYLTQNQIIQGFQYVPDYRVEFNSPTEFGSTNQTNIKNFELISAILIIFLGLLFFSCNRIRKRPNTKKFFPSLYTGATFSLWLLTIALWVMPYRLINDNEFEEIQYKHKPAYVISEKDSRIFLYIPGKYPFIVEKNDSLLSRTGERYYKNIFDN